MGYFQTTPGFADCPKCFGWQIRDLTKRDSKGWPLEAAKIVDCDHCGGKGEVPAAASAKPIVGWGAQPVAPPLPAPPPTQEPKRRGRKPSNPAIDDDVAMPPEPSPAETLAAQAGWGADMAAALDEDAAKLEALTGEQHLSQICGGCGQEIVHNPWTGTQCGCNAKPIDNQAPAANGWAIFGKETGQ